MTGVVILVEPRGRDYGCASYLVYIDHTLLDKLFLEEVKFVDKDFSLLLFSISFFHTSYAKGRNLPN